MSRFDAIADIDAINLGLRSITDTYSVTILSDKDPLFMVRIETNCDEPIVSDLKFTNIHEAAVAMAVGFKLANINAENGFQIKNIDPNNSGVAEKEMEMRAVCAEFAHVKQFFIENFKRTVDLGKVSLMVTFDQR